MAFMSIVIQMGERNMVEGRFKRALKSRTFKDKQRLLFIALIEIKSRNDE